MKAKPIEHPISGETCLDFLPGDKVVFYSDRFVRMHYWIEEVSDDVPEIKI